MDSTFFDGWSSEYDVDVASTAEVGDFPFAGYEEASNEVCHVAQVRPGMSILDVGTGTGSLAKRFVALQCDVLGTDFSPKMLEKAREEVPQARFVEADLVGAWPDAMNRRFDRIVAGYVLHELDLATKMGLLERFAKHHLADNGLIIIVDISYPSAEKRQEVAENEDNGWDPDEFYWAADETIGACEKAGLKGAYKQISHCAGVYVFAVAK